MVAGWGALLGMGAVVIAGFFTGGVAWTSLPFLATAGAAAGAGVAAIGGKMLSSFGDTPKNELSKIGVDPNKLYEEATKYRNERKQFLEEKNQEDQKKVDDLDKKLESLDEGIKNMQKEITNMDDTDPNKAKKIVEMNNLQDQINSVQKERDGHQKKIDGRNDKIDKVFQELGDPVKYGSTQYNNNANSPRWGSYKNWGIGLFCVVIFFMLIGFIKKIFTSLLSSLK